MNYEANKLLKIINKYKTLFTFFFVFGSLILLNGGIFAQSPTPTPLDNVTIGDFQVKSSVEIGARWVDVNGSENTFRSDLNYKKGLRVFDSSFLLESKEPRKNLFDTIQVTSSGWGGDPQGFTRIGVERLGFYRFDANIRRIVYFNNLNNHALNEHTQNVKNNFGDFDLTIFPQSERLRFNFGFSYNQANGPGSWTTRAYGDEFPIEANFQTRANDLRAGVEGKFFGFNLGLNGGYRFFTDESRYFLTVPNLGNNPTNNARLTTFDRQYPISGDTFYSLFRVQRTFAKRVDFTARIIYSQTDTDSRMFERITGRDNSNNQVDLDNFEIFGQAKRTQTRGDFGATFMITDDFRISDTFSFDKFSINGGENFLEQLFRRNAAGNPLATTTTRSTAYRVTDYQRFVNTIEGDYQFNNRFGLHIGYRYTNRDVEIRGFDLTLTSAPSPTNPNNFIEDGDNTTNTFLAGMKIKPLKNWVIFWDVEHGESDNVFTRLANYDFTHFRVRSRLSFNKFAINVSAISKDNRNPSLNEEMPTREFGVDVNNRTYSASLDWIPTSKINFNAGYTYQHLTSQTAIIVPVSGQLREGTSLFFIRDHSFFVDVFAKPSNRISFFASYRINKDLGQGDRTSALIENIIGSYPLQFQTPEARLTIRLTKNIDWNIGYQYYDYKERFQSLQNYRAHLPYTSLRIYFGGADR